MSSLFGIDIEAIVHREISPGLLPGTLTAFRAGDHKADATAGREKVTTQHTFRGIIDFYKENAFEGMHAKRGQKTVLMTGGSISPFIVPEKNDELVLDGESLVITELIERDPASASFLFAVKGLH